MALMLEWFERVGYSADIAGLFHALRAEREHRPQQYPLPMILPVCLLSGRRCLWPEQQGDSFHAHRTGG
jgi:hypothetical protein